MMTGKHRVGWLIFVVLFFCFSYINQIPGYNQLSRLDLLHAMVTDGTFAIDRYHGNTADKAQIGGHYYSEKAPGAAVLALPAFLLATGVLRLADVALDSDTGWTVTTWAATAGSVGLLSAIAGVCFWLFLRRIFGDRSAALITLALFLGSLIFSYATMLFSHGLVMSLFFIALWALDRAERGSDSWESALCGFCCGMAVACEYPAAIGAVAIGVAMLTLGRRSALQFFLGALPPLLLIPAYNFAVSGSPLTIGYAQAHGFPGMKEGVFGFRTPDLRVMFQLLFSEYRGLFFWSPVLLLCFSGFAPLLQKSQRLFWLSVTVPVILTLTMSAYYYWDGGYALGPRNILIAVPFLALAAAHGFRVSIPLAAVVSIFSVLMVSFFTFVNAMPPEGVTQVSAYAWQQMSAGTIAMNAGQWIGLHGLWGLVPLVCVVVAGATLLMTGWADAPHKHSSASGRKGEPRFA